MPGRGCSLLSACVRAFQGVSPALMEGLCTVTEVDSSVQPTQLRDSQWDRLFSAWQDWLDILASGNFQPALDPHSGRLSVIGSLREPYEGDVHAAVEHLFQSSQACSHFSHFLCKLCMLVLPARTICCDSSRYTSAGRGAVSASEAAAAEGDSTGGEAFDGKDYRLSTAAERLAANRCHAQAGRHAHGKRAQVSWRRKHPCSLND